MDRWLPLESNPEVMNKFLSLVGVSPLARVHDVFGLDPELLAIVPQPVHAVLLLYPLNDESEAVKASQEDAMKGQKQPEGVYFMKQLVGNACGTVALMHAVANCRDRISLEDGEFKQFLDKTSAMTPDEKGAALCSFEALGTFHAECAQEGQTEAPDKDQKLDTHFIAFVLINGHIYELDGRKSHPIDHGTSTHEDFLGDTAVVVKTFMERDPNSQRFAVLALGAQD